MQWNWNLISNLVPNEWHHFPAKNAKMENDEFYIYQYWCKILVSRYQNWKRRLTMAANWKQIPAWVDWNKPVRLKSKWSGLLLTVNWKLPEVSSASVPVNLPKVQLCWHAWLLMACWWGTCFKCEHCLSYHVAGATSRHWYCKSIGCIWGLPGFKST